MEVVDGNSLYCDEIKNLESSRLSDDGDPVSTDEPIINENTSTNGQSGEPQHSNAAIKSETDLPQTSNTSKPTYGFDQDSALSSPASSKSDDSEIPTPAHR